jgi:CheY-like chemotaxis protein
MKRILFVDDERHILNGLRRQLHGLRAEWSMTFAVGGPEAISELDTQVFDLVLTDMQMPVVDGAQVLAHAAKVQERCARMVLSGHADPDRLLLAASCAHRYLDKPCPPDLLQMEIRQALSVRETLDELNDPELERLWCRQVSEDVAMDEVAVGLSNQSAVSADDVIVLLSRDGNLWKRVRSLLEENDAVHDPESAVHVFGARTLLSVMMVARLFRTAGLDPDPVPGGTHVGSLAARIAAERNQPDEVSDDAFTAALLHSGLAVGHDDLWLDVLAYLLPTCGFSDACVVAVTRGDRLEKPMGASLGVCGALTAARLSTGQSEGGELARFLEAIGWGDGVDGWTRMDGAHSAN